IRSFQLAGQGQRIRPTLILKALSFAAFRAARGNVYKHIDPVAMLQTSSLLRSRSDKDSTNTKPWPTTAFSIVEPPLFGSFRMLDSFQESIHRGYRFPSVLALMKVRRPQTRKLSRV
ncbi:hypothetical protein BDFB_011069, partial [Asbolus verrucosus]